MCSYRRYDGAKWRCRASFTILMHFRKAVNSCWLGAFGVDVFIHPVVEMSIFLQLMTWISNWFSLPSKSVTFWCEETLSLTGSVDVWFISLYALAVMPVTSVKPAGVFPQVLEST